MNKKIFVFPVALIVGFLIWSLMINTHQRTFGAQSVPFQKNVLFAVYGFTVTLIGVFLGSAYRALQALREKGTKRIPNLGKFFTGLLSSVDLWIGIVSAPIVFALIWQSLATVSIAGLTVVALQNGFCCTLIVGNLVSGQAAGVSQPVKKEEIG
ncbi:hypothetical protein MKQ70_31990 [Chitinophaga sedimenti]|uniref:hypothetical protein n=1 Tax=Chitinophaga sedimenti TaxID=2033606 RepID=UPI002005C9DE|nr:hypothetical protein [Chitinophaga sedimenti]MCK7559339.1 hypothetical protein [Chitinophaga sedimenti]